MFSRQGSKKSWDENLEKYILEDASTPKNARNLAEQTVTKILEEPNLINLIPRHGRRKHLPSQEIQQMLLITIILKLSLLNFGYLLEQIIEEAQFQVLGMLGLTTKLEKVSL